MNNLPNQSHNTRRKKKYYYLLNYIVHLIYIII